MPKQAYKKMVVESPSEFKVRTGIYTDPQIFEDEMRNIFERTWVYVAHESQVSKPGDYYTTHIGRQPVIVSRSRADKIHVLLNMCRHRGSVVCREEQGNTNFFRCPYHGWVYENSGALVSIAEPGGYRDDFGKGIAGLVEAPRVGVYRGLIFASLSPTGESLEDHLGEIREYVDLWVDRSPEGVVRVLRPHKYSYPGNWKFQAEQDTDGYHGLYVHDSAFKTLEHFHGKDFRKERRVAVHEIGHTRSFHRGHCLLEHPGTRGELTSELFEEYMARLAERYGAKRAEQIVMVRHILLYPNVYLMDDHIRVHHPLSVDRTEVHSFFTFLEGVPQGVNNARLKNLNWRHSQAGFIGTDDVEMYLGCQTGMQAFAVGSINLSRGLHREVSHPTGERVGHSSDETPQRAMAREWVRLMSAGEST